MNYKEARQHLAMLQRRYEETRILIAAIDRHWRDAAEEIAVRQAGKSRRCYRHQTSWTAADERRYLIARDTLAARFGHDRDRSERKAQRQLASIEAIKRKYRFNE